MGYQASTGVGLSEMHPDLTLSLIIIPLMRTKIRNLRGAAMTVLQLSHVPEITVSKGKIFASKYCYSHGVKNQSPFRAHALSL